VNPHSNSFNLEKTVVLIVDGDAMSMSISSQILAGFGARNLHKCDNSEAAKRVVERTNLDLLVIDPSTVGSHAHDFVPWLRREVAAPNRFVPILVVTGHTPQSRVDWVRNSGANFVVAKPLSPATMMNRIMWLAGDKRPFVDCRGYAGPDRRWKFDGPPAGSAGRRETDLPADVGEPREANLSQSDIDAVMQPRKVSL